VSARGRQQDAGTPPGSAPATPAPDAATPPTDPSPADTPPADATAAPNDAAATPADTPAPASPAAPAEPPPSEEPASPAADAAAHEPPPPPPRVRVTAGAGFGWTHETHDAGHPGLVRLTAMYIGVRDLEVGGNLELQSYGRTYTGAATDLPSGAAPHLDVDEVRVRIGLMGSYDILPALGVERGLGRLAPVLGLWIDRFSNDLFPQTAFEMGFGLDAGLRLSGPLLAKAAIVYAPVATAGPDNVQRGMLAGGLLASLRYSLGVAARIPPRARLHLRYQGEQLAHEHTWRSSHSVIVALDLEL